MISVSELKNPLEDIKVEAVLNGEIKMLEYRLKNKPKEVNILDYTVISALMLQVPMKPLNISCPVIKQGTCPRCKGELSKIGGRPAVVLDGQKYCSDCGQRLDWSEDIDLQYKDRCSEGKCND